MIISSKETAKFDHEKDQSYFFKTDLWEHIVI